MVRFKMEAIKKQNDFMVRFEMEAIKKQNYLRKVNNF